MKKILLLAGVFALALTQNLSAQMAYSRQYFTGAYTPVSGSATALTFSSNDDGDVAVPLPFNFTYAGTSYVATTNFLIVCTNGWTQLSTTGTLPTASASNVDVFTVAGSNNLIAPWFDDLNIGAVGTNPAGGVSWEVTGVTPNRVMTVQWTVSSYYTTTGGQPRVLNFQEKLYETSNVIEFWYGTSTGTNTNTNESASLGLKDATGGNGHYLDGVTGSGFTGSAYLQGGQFPKFQMRFTPGAPTAIAAGTYNVGVGQTYRNLTDAFADVNNRGVSGPVVLNLTDATYDTTAAGGNNIFPLMLGPIAGVSAANTVTVTKSSSAAVVQWGGVIGTGTFLVNQASTAALSSGTDFIIGLVGADRITLNNLDIRGNIGFKLADFGLGVFNSSATDGSQNNNFTSISTTMNRANTGSVGIRQNTLTTATAASGSNSNNTYKGLTVKSSFSGIYLSGTAAFPDDACQIGTAACGTFNLIGDPLTANDIGNGGLQTWGIRVQNNSNVSVYNNVVVNVTCTGANSVDGIFVDNSGIAGATAAGTCQVYNNNIGFITGTSTSTSVVRGIRCSLNANAGSSSRIYNNTISNLNSASISTTLRRVIGISVQDAGGGAGATHNVDFNSVRIAPAVVLCSNTCFEIGTTAGPVINVRNNVFANFTGAQTTVKHYCWVSTSATLIGNAGSISNYNDLFVNNTTNGFTGLGSATDYATLANWQTAMTQDANSIAIDPQFSSATDLHASAAGLDNAGNNTGITWVTNDIDCQTRPQPAATNFDIGADELAACSGAPTAGTASGNPVSRCGSGTFTLQDIGASTGIGITYQWKESSVSGGPYVNCTTGSGFTTTTFTTASISTTMYYVCVVTCSNSGISVTTNEVAATILTPPTVTANPTSGSVCLGGTGTTVTANGASTYTWLPATGLNTTTGSTVIANPSASTTYTVTGTAANGCTGTATSALTVNEVPSVISVTATPPSVCSGGNSQLQVTAGLTSSYTITNIPFAPVATPGSGVTTLANAGTAVTPLSAATTLDDGYWQNQPLPFPFTYFGTIYTAFSPTTNGFIWLGAGVPNTYTAYNNTMPSATMGHPAIGAAYSDLDWRNMGTINYFTTGSAPNRKFVINYSGGQFYNGVGNITTQIIIYETSNVIEVHTAASSGTNPEVEGIQNAAGTVAYVVAGRNNTNYTVGTPDGYRWTPSGGALTYLWSPGTFLSSTTVSNPMANGVTATTTYTAAVTNAGCSSSGTVTLVAGSVLSASGTISPASLVCTGTNVTLNGTPSGGGAPYTYSWTGPNSFTSTVQNPTISGVTIANSGTYSLVVTDNCLATFTVTLNLTVNPLPTVGVSPTSATFCTGGPAVALAASGASTYAWSPSAGLSATTGANVNASPVLTTTYTVTGTDANGCVNTSSTTITSAPGITGASATASPTVVCVGSTTTLNATSNGLPAVLLNENFNTGAPSWTRTNTSTGGTPANAAWTDRPDGYVYAAGTPYHSNDNSQFVQTNSDAQGSGSTTRTTLQSPAFNTTGYTSLNLNFYQYYRDIADPGDSAVIEMSLNAVNWTIVTAYTASTGSENAFTNSNVAIPASYENQPTVYVRFRYIGTWDWYWSLDNVSITGLSSSGLTYSWTSAPAGFTSSVQSPTDNPTANTTYSVVITSPAGCSASASVAVGVNPLPTVTATASANPVCVNSSETLTGSGASTYTWTGGVTDGVAFNMPGPSGNASYTVTGTDANGCTNTASVTITVNALPVVNVSGSSPICAGDTATITATGGGTSQWYMNGSAIVGATTSSYNATMAGVYNMTKTNLNGCSDSAATGFTLVVNALPTVTANTSASAVCNGSPVTVTGSGATTYSWSGGVTDGIAFNPTSTNTYTVTGTDANGCMNMDSVTVTVNALPTVVANTTASAVCSGSPVTLTGSGASTYSWSGGVTDGVAFTPVTSLTYTVTGTDGNGCMNMDSVAVTVNPNPTVMASSSDTTICSGDSVTFLGMGANTYTWNNGVTDGVAASVSSSGTYVVTGTDMNGCTGMDSIAITAMALPNVMLTLPLDTACINLGWVALSGESPAGGTWSGPGVTGSNFDPGATGSGIFGIMYTYMDTATGCSATATDSITADICNDVLTNGGVTIDLYPNPNNGEFVLIPSGSGVVDVYIYNSAGQLVSAQQANCSQSNPIRIDASGLYNITVVAADGSRTTHRVIVNR